MERKKIKFDHAGYANITKDLIRDNPVLKSVADCWDGTYKDIRPMVDSCVFLDKYYDRRSWWPMNIFLLKSLIVVLMSLIVVAISYVLYECFHEEIAGKQLIVMTVIFTAGTILAVVGGFMLMYRIEIIHKWIDEYDNVGWEVRTFHEIAKKVLLAHKIATGHDDVKSWQDVSDISSHIDDLCLSVLFWEELGTGESKPEAYPISDMRNDLRELVDLLKQIGADPNNGNLKPRFDRARDKLLAGLEESSGTGHLRLLEKQ